MIEIIEMIDMKTMNINIFFYFLCKVIAPPGSGIISTIIPEDYVLHVLSTEMDETAGTTGATGATGATGTSKPHYQSVTRLIDPDTNMCIIQNFDVKEPMTYGDFKKKAEEHEPPPNETCIDRENRFWREINERAISTTRATRPSKGMKRSKDPICPIYCILEKGTCFAESSSMWNLSKFSGKESVIHALDEEKWFDGIHRPYRYLGMFGTSFAWHREDRNLFSINYLHSGSEKIWYAVAFEYAERFEKLLQSEVDELPASVRRALRLNCNSVVRHKVVHADPSFLREHNIPFGKVIN